MNSTHGMPSRNVAGLLFVNWEKSSSRKPAS